MGLGGGVGTDGLLNSSTMHQFVPISPIMGQGGSDVEDAAYSLCLRLAVRVNLAFELESLVRGVQCQLGSYDVYGFSKMFPPYEVPVV
jgi:hypothetical protein